LVDQVFNDSTGGGQDREIDARGPWNQGANWQFIDAPAFQDVGVHDEHAASVASVDDRSTSTASEPEIADTLLTQIARELMSESRTGPTKGPKHAAATKSVAD
jgi:Mn-containing catalase